MTSTSVALDYEFSRLIKKAFTVSKDVGETVEEVLREGMDNPLPPEEARVLLTRVIERLQKHKSFADGSSAGLKEFVEHLVLARAQGTSGPAQTAQPEKVVTLQEHNGIKPRPVLPKPVFHGREVALNEGYVRTRDINLWDSNERIEIHLQQFYKRHGRKPSPQELLDIMFSNLKLEGVSEDDQFKIPALARSIAANGIRRPPIIDRDGTLLDGNRRLAACYYILLDTSDEFTTQQKAKVEHILVWQLTEHATRDDIDAIIVSLNFESDHKQDWPEYVKARKVWEEWQAALALNPNANMRQMALMKRTISQRFALGPEAATVSRYIKMVEGAQEFEDYHVHERNRDPYGVKHKAAEYFQYFDELSKGTGAGGVAYELNQSPELKHAVFELLYTDKFKNWRQIRDLRYVAANEEARELLFKAAGAKVDSEEELEDAQEKLDNALSIGRVRRAAERTLGANTRIEAFVEWLLELPLSAFETDIKKENLMRLWRAFSLISKVVQSQATGGHGDSLSYQAGSDQLPDL